MERGSESCWSIDCHNMPTPYPLLGARAAIALMNDGDILWLLLTDPDSIADMPAWCRMTGNRLVGIDERSGVRCFLIRKGNVAMPKSLKDLIDDAKSRIREVRPSEAAEALKKEPKTLILDVREAGEWAEGHIAGALHVPRGTLEAKADLEYANREPRLADRSQPIIVHCASGARSALAADVLQQMGFTNVQSMAGGITAWKEKGLPIER